MNAKSFLRSLFFIGALCAFVSCDIRKKPGMNDYVQTVQSGIQKLTWPKEMEALFGDSDHFITHYGFSPGPKEWHSKVYIYGRYELTMVVDVNIDYDQNKIIGAVSNAQFFLVRFSEIVDNGKGANFAGQWILNESKWKQLVQTGGDFTAIGIPIETNNPVAGFQEYVKGDRALWVKIPH